MRRGWPAYPDPTHGEPREDTSRIDDDILVEPGEVREDGDLFTHRGCGGLLLVDAVRVRCNQCGDQWLRS